MRKSILKRKFLKYLKKYDVELYAYCIMSNHAHLIIKAELPVLSAFMAVVLAEYAVYYNLSTVETDMFKKQICERMYRNGSVLLELSEVYP